MATPDELAEIVHFAKSTPPVPGIARQTLAQLRKRWGFVEKHKEPPDFVRASVAPDFVRVSGMTTEVWRRVDDGSRGESTNYQLEGP